MPSGYYPINLEIGTTPINIINPQDSFYLITSPGSTPTVVIQDMYAQTYNTEGIPDNPAGVGVGHTATDVSGLGESINIFAYNFPAGSTGFTFFSADGLITSPITPTAFTSTGAYAMGGSTLPYPGVSVNAVPGGTYLVSATASNSAYGTQVAAPANAALFTVVASLNVPITASHYLGYIGSSVSFYATGLAPNTNYVGVFNGQVLLAPSGIPVTYMSDSSGSVGSSSSPDSFIIPPVYVNETNGFSVYSFSLAPLSSPTRPVATASVVVLYPSTISISPTPAGYAFPGEIVQFSVSGLGSSTLPLGSATGKPAYFMMVDLNSTPYQYVPAEYSSSGTMTGSFIMPDNASGTYYEMTFTGYESTISAFTSSSTSGYVNVTAAFPNSQSDFIELVSGNGALITGISQSQIASIDASVNATLSVPISQLEASVSSIDGNIAHLTTVFDNMTASLNAIGATVSSIESGIAIVNTTLGTVKTSLSSINATIVSMNGSLVKVSTTAGKLTTTLSSINLEVTNISAGIATIQTDLGTFTGSVKSVSDGIATIETSLGTIKVNVGNLKSSVTQIQNYGLILDVVLIALVAVTLGIAVGTFLSTRDMRKRFGMKKE